MQRQKSYHFPFASFPAVRILIIYVAGITAACYISPGYLSLLLMTGAAATAWITAEFISRNKYPLVSGRIATLSYLLIIFSTGMTLFSLEEYNKVQDIRNSSPLQLYAWENIEVRGDTEQVGSGAGERPVLVVSVSETIFPEGVEWYHPYRIRVYGQAESDKKIQPGQKIAAEIRLYEFPERRNPHEFDYGKWLHQKQIVAHGELVSAQVIEKSDYSAWKILRSFVHENVEKVFSEEYIPLVKALVLGNKEELTPETRQQFSRAGLSHIMAVSGLHVGFIVAPFWLLIPFFWGSEKGKWLGLLFLTILLTGYAGLTGFSASVSRASLMAWLLTYGRLFHKVRNSLNLTAVAAILLLLINPAQLFDVGFQLSFSAVFIILLVMPEAQRLIPLKYRFGKTGGFLTIIIVSVVVQAGLFPLLIYYFGEFSIAGPLANAAVVPLLSITVPAALVFALAGPVELSLFKLAVLPVQYSIDWIEGTASFLGSLESSYVTLNSQPISLFLVWLSAVLCIAALRLPSLRWKFLICLLLALNVFVVESTFKEDNKDLEITFLDVGQGDAIHIKTPGGKHILVDAGRWSPLGNSGDRVIIPYLNSAGIEKIDALILSHPHADHIGGVPSLIEIIPVEEIYQSGYEYDSALYEEYMRLAKEKNIPVIAPVAGDMIEIDPALRIFVLGPERKKLNHSNPNNSSLAFKLIYGETSVLFSGDAEKEQEKQIVERYGDFLDADLYKAGHHGSSTSTTESFIKNISPKITVVSLAFHNNFGHPGTETINRLHNYSDRQEFTSLSGAVKFRSNGGNFEELDW